MCLRLIAETDARSVGDIAILLSSYLRLLPLLAAYSTLTLVFDRRTFPVLRMNSWTGDHFVGKLSAMGQSTRPNQPFIRPRGR